MKERCTCRGTGDDCCSCSGEGFQSAFIESNAWWAIRISFSMLNHIKYIAVYQVAPISAITHVAEVSRIENIRIPISISFILKNLPEKLIL